jgi:predicted secreted protein
MKRRTLLTGSLARGVLAVAAGAGLIRPVPTLASPGPRDAFEATNEADVLRLLFGAEDATPNAGVKIEAPLQAMYGKGVPVKVRCD